MFRLRVWHLHGRAPRDLCSQFSESAVRRAHGINKRSYARLSSNNHTTIGPDDQDFEPANFFLVLITIYKYCEIQKKGKKKKLDNLLFLLNFNKK